MAETHERRQDLPARNPEWNQDANDHHIAEALQANADPAVVQLRQDYEELRAAGQLDGQIECPDGREHRAFALHARRIQQGAALTVTDLNYEVMSLLAANVPDNVNMQKYLAWLVGLSGTPRQVKAIDVAPHTGKNLSGCGAEAVRAALDKDREGTLRDAHHHGIDAAANWVDREIPTSNPGVQAIVSARRIWSMTQGAVPVTAWVFNHELQKYIPLEEHIPGKKRTSVYDRDDLQGWSWDGSDQLIESDLSDRALQILAANKRNSSIAAAVAQERHFGEGQSFRRIVITEGARLIELELGRNLVEADGAFKCSIPASPDADDNDLEEGLRSAMAAASYGIAHAKPDTEIYLLARNRERAYRALQHLLSLPPAQKFISDPSMQEVAVFTYDQKTGLFTNSLLVKPAHQAVGQVNLR